MGARVWGTGFGSDVFLLFWLFVLAKLWLCQHILLAEGQFRNLTDQHRFQMPEFLEPKSKQFRLWNFGASAIVKHLHSMLKNAQFLNISGSWYSHLVIASGPSASIFPYEVMSGWTPHARGKCVVMPWATAVSAAWWFVWPVPQIAVAWSKSLPVWGVVWRILYFLLKNRGYSNNRLCWEIQEG